MLCRQSLIKDITLEWHGLEFLVVGGRRIKEQTAIHIQQLKNWDLIATWYNRINLLLVFIFQDNIPSAVKINPIPGRHRPSLNHLRILKIWNNPKAPQRNPRVIRHSLERCKQVLRPFSLGTNLHRQQLNPVRSKDPILSVKEV